MTTWFVFREAGPYPVLQQLADRIPALAGVVSGLTRDSVARRSPRSRVYMERLAAETFAEFDRGRMVVVDDDTTAGRMDWASAEAIVLLWPDANGSGWSRLERAIFRRKAASAPVSVLTGRRRRFLLTARLWRVFRLRRLLQKALVGEFLFLVVFLAATPPLWVFDLVTRRRRAES